MALTMMVILSPKASLNPAQVFTFSEPSSTSFLDLHDGLLELEVLPGQQNIEPLHNLPLHRHRQKFHSKNLKLNVNYHTAPVTEPKYFNHVLVLACYD